LSDPLLFAHKIKPENVIMINSKFDFLFCRESTNQLLKELSKPKIYWLNNFHTSSVLNNNKILRLIFNFLDKANTEKVNI
jgi:nitrogenase molybdenum-iron protein alpha/beta subunit